MQTRAIGSLNASIVGLGCNNFGRRIDYDRTVEVVNASLDAGINFFDTADVYGSGQSEEYLGRAIKGRRNEVIIATKFGNEMEGQGKGAHPDYVKKAAEASLKRLNVEVIDLYQLHKPDPDVPIADTLGALNELVQAGKVLEIGCSNFSAQQLRDADAGTKSGAAKFVSVQNHYSLLQREPEAEVLAECERLGQGFLPYFPLAMGLLTGKFRQGQPVPEGTRLTANEAGRSDEKLAIVEKLIAFAESRGHTILELAISWLLMRPVVSSVIAGATSAAQVKSNVAAAGWQLSDADMREIDTLLSQPVA
jgi:aryl-alcohol dehydrogenase-like predicted oxidoreductase